MYELRIAEGKLAGQLDSGETLKLSYEPDVDFDKLSDSDISEIARETGIDESQIKEYVGYKGFEPDEDGPLASLAVAISRVQISCHDFTTRGEPRGTSLSLRATRRFARRRTASAGILANGASEKSGDARPKGVRRPGFEPDPDVLAPSGRCARLVGFKSRVSNSRGASKFTTPPGGSASLTVCAS